MSPDNKGVSNKENTRRRIQGTEKDSDATQLSAFANVEVATGST